jgi:MFS family permease
MMLTLADPKAFPLFAVASILVSIAALPVALTKSPAPAPIASVQIRIRYLFKSSPVGVVGALVVGFANGSFWSLAPVFAQSNSAVAGTSGIATFMSISVIAGAMAQWPFGWLSDRIDRRKVIVIVCVGAAAMGIGMAVLGQRWENAAYVFSFLFGLFAFPLYAICAAHMNDSVEEGGFVEAAGGLLLLYGTGAVIGPILASASMRLVGGEGLYFFTAVAHMAMAGFAIYRLGRRERRPEAEREPFADSVRIAQTVATIDPLPEALAKED